MTLRSIWSLMDAPHRLISFSMSITFQLGTLKDSQDFGTSREITIKRPRRRVKTTEEAGADVTTEDRLDKTDGVVTEPEATSTATRGDTSAAGKLLITAELKQVLHMNF